MRIGEREIGPGHPPYIIAEIGVNHDGDPERALELTDVAADVGADAIKLQYFETDRLMSKDAKLAAYQKAAGETDPVEMLRRLELPLDEMAHVIEQAHARSLHAIVTVFSMELVEAANELPWDAYKSASPDLINWPLLRALMDTGKPLIVSTGAAEFAEVQSACSDILEPLGERLGLLQCVSCYPTRRVDAAIAAIRALDLGVLARGGALGYSDHTGELDTGRLAVRAGGSILEKHLTYSRSAAGPDHAASLDPDLFAQYVCETRQAATSTDDLDQLMSSDPAFGRPEKLVLDCEKDVRHASRQSLVATRPILRGERLQRADLTTKRPGVGIEPFWLEDIIGTKASRDIEANTPLVPEDLAWNRPADLPIRIASPS